MRTNKTLRIVEAFHILAFMVFSAWIPFCFEAMPRAGQRRLETQAEPSCSRPLKEPMITEPENLRLMADFAQAERKGADVLVGGDEAAFISDIEGCLSPDNARLTVLPFLIALIGGGVFSLEAFEAFPML
mmetsp:Transcript_12818/g.29074  ORF Transcript_12818/g.29074 Transcript_12818/m.29074 type:complete len:130 (-) Transcript_12818:130-519(-)